MNKKTIGIIIAIAVILIIGYLVYSPAYKSPQEQIIDTEATEITINGEEYSLTPSSITVSKGVTIRITFNNIGGISHNFGIPELGIRTKTVSPGNSDTVELVANQAGTFDFDCSIPGHKEGGMLGSLNIN